MRAVIEGEGDEGMAGGDAVGEVGVSRSRRGKKDSGSIREDE